MPDAAARSHLPFLSPRSASLFHSVRPALPTALRDAASSFYCYKCINLLNITGSCAEYRSSARAASDGRQCAYLPSGRFRHEAAIFVTHTVRNDGEVVMSSGSSRSGRSHSRVVGPGDALMAAFAGLLVCLGVVSETLEDEDSSQLAVHLSRISMEGLTNMQASTAWTRAERLQESAAAVNRSR
jgi:hypothetical protein